MCKVVIADNAGFCFGVKRAIDKAFNCAKNDNVYAYGSLIHNDEVMKELIELGVKKINTLDEFYKLPQGTVIIRSHGISKFEEETLKKIGHEIINTTCPYVKKIHKIVNKFSKLGNKIIIFGNRNHPEIMGIIGWCETTPIVIENMEDLDKINFDNNEKYVLVAQTTFNISKFKHMVEKLRQKCYNISVLDTICSATEERQLSTRQLASISDVMIVVGDKNSSNTQKLYDISCCECKETYFIQTASDMDFSKLAGKKLVGITAGASTPEQIIEEVKEECQKILNKCWKKKLSTV